MTLPIHRLSIVGATKAYPGIVALDDVTFHVAPGEVHGLLGENGAGKSTMLNILSGVRPGDKGHIEIDGHRVDLRNPLAARAAGIAMIHQELQHVPELTVAQNIFLGRSLTRAGGFFVRHGAQEQRAREILEELDPSIDPSVPIKTLKVAQQQIVEIARALLDDARIIAMDEPTSSLTPSEFDRLAGLIKTLTDRDVSVIYVSHKMNEVFQVCQRATILRDGKKVAVVNIVDETEESIVAKMVGRDVVQVAHSSFCTDEVILSVKDLTRGKFVQNATFNLRQGEVLGISGLVGAGRTELLRLIAGIDARTAGKVLVDGREIRPHDPRAAIRAGIGLVPEERKKEGIVHARSVATNIALPSMKQFTHFGFLNHDALREKAKSATAEMQLRPPNVDQPIETFSGGNQQKAIIARWLVAQTKVFLFDEPTRGIDVGTKSEIYNLIEKLAQAGNAIIVVSSEMPEIIRVSDRVLVMREGRIVANLEQDDISETQIAYHAIPRKNQVANLKPRELT